MVGKRGFIKIVEAVVALLMIMGVILIVVDKGYFSSSDISEKVYEDQLNVLREIQSDNYYREIILGINEEELPIESKDEVFPEGLILKVNSRIPSYLSCDVKICKLEEVCEWSVYREGDVYAQAAAITTARLEDESQYSPRQIKLFCVTN